MAGAATVTPQEVWSAQLLRMMNDQDGIETPPDVLALAEMDIDHLPTVSNEEVEDVKTAHVPEGSEHHDSPPNEMSDDEETSRSIRIVKGAASAAREAPDTTRGPGASPEVVVVQPVADGSVVVRIDGEDFIFTATREDVERSIAASAAAKEQLLLHSRLKAVHTGLPEMHWPVPTMAPATNPIFPTGRIGSLWNHFEGRSESWDAITFAQLVELPREILEAALKAKDAVEAEQREKQSR